MQKQQKRIKISISNWKFKILIFLVLIGLLNLFSRREGVIIYQRKGELWGMPHSVHFSYTLKNGEEIIQGWYVENIISNFIIYTVILFIILSIPYIKKWWQTPQ